MIHCTGINAHHLLRQLIIGSSEVRLREYKLIETNSIPDWTEWIVIAYE